MIWFIGIVWMVCGFISYGLGVGFYQNNWPDLAYEDRYNDRIFCGLVSLFGPISLSVSLLMNRPYRWKL